MKYLYLLLFLPFLSSCQEDTIIYDLDAVTIFLEARPADWAETGDLNIWSAVYNVPEIDDIVLNNGFVLVYKEVFNPSGFRQLPYTEVYNDPQDETIQYSIEKQYEFGFGEIEIQHVNSLPYLDEIQPPIETEFYKVVVVTGDYSVPKPDTWEEWETIKQEYKVKERIIEIKP